jgi:hypothetical protein
VLRCDVCNTLRFPHVCAQGNYEFGISRVMKSLEPYDKKLGTDTWYYAKRCILGLAETLAKHMIMLKDSTFHEIINFLDAADHNGKSILTVISQVCARGLFMRRCVNATHQSNDSFLRAGKAPVLAPR